MVNISIGRTIIKYIENAPNKLVIIASIRMMSIIKMTKFRLKVFDMIILLYT